MAREINLSLGGYGGDDIENGFKWFTSQHLEYWWHFREVLRPSTDKHNVYWKMVDGTSMSDEDHRKLIAVCLLNYAVYTGMVESFSFFDELRGGVVQQNLFIVRRSWKALYSSLYSSFNAFCNLVCVIAFKESPFGNKPNTIWNKTPKETLKLARSQNKPTIAQVVESCQNRLEIRDHLDHYWTIWTGFRDGKFLVDQNFKKGYVLLDPAAEIKLGFDGVQRAIDHITGCASDFNLIYKEMAVTRGYLDQYLAHNGWCIEYQDYGVPHNQKRPVP